MAVRQADVVDVLRRVPLFSTLSQRELRTVARECSQVRYEPGETLFRELDHGQHMVAVVEGSADVRRNRRGIGTVGPGDAVGEMSLIDDRPRSATVVANEPIVGIILYKTAFKRLLAEQPAMCAKLLLAQTTRLRDADKRAAAIG